MVSHLCDYLLDLHLLWLIRTRLLFMPQLIWLEEVVAVSYVNMRLVSANDARINLTLYPCNMINTCIANSSNASDAQYPVRTSMYIGM
jgi:hypothetical protein